MSRPDRRNPYWPGTVLRLVDGGAPRLENVIDELPVELTHAHL